MNVHEPKRALELPTNWPKLLLVGAFVVVAIIVLARPPTSSRPGTSAPRDDPAAELHADYGGSLAEYRRIFALTDCADLSDWYDAFLTIQDSEVDGTSAYFVANGYKRAAAQRMIALDC
jgi:hypothetical protein